MNMAKTFLFVYNKILPFVVFPAMAWLWATQTNLAFAAFVMGLPLLYGYIVPGIGTNVIKLWRFFDQKPWMLGNYFIHHGFIYSAALSAALYITFIPTAINDGWGWVVNMIRLAGLAGFVGWFHDTVALREGMLAMYNTPWKQGASPEAVAFHYGPLGFTSTGASFAACVLVAHHFLVVQNDPASLGWLVPLSLGLMALVVSVPYLLIEKTASASSIIPKNRQV